MVELADNSKLFLADSRRNSAGIEENPVIRKISVVDHLNRFQYSTEKKSDNFVIDMESFNNIDDNINSNSRITKSLCRKGSSSGGGSDTVVPAASSSPRGSSTPEKVASPPLVVARTMADHTINPQFEHHITVSTTASNTSTDSRFAFKRNSFKRPPFSLAFDPKRLLFIFATISSMGTILLIYFTLAIGNYQDLQYE